MERALMLNGKVRISTVKQAESAARWKLSFNLFLGIFIPFHRSSILLLHLCNRRNFLGKPPPNFTGSCLLFRFNRRSGRHSFTQLYFNPSNRGVLVVEYKNDFLYPSVFTEASMLCSTIIIVIIIIIINVVFLLDLLDDTLTRKRRNSCSKELHIQNTSFPSSFLFKHRPKGE